MKPFQGSVAYGHVTQGARPSAATLGYSMQRLRRKDISTVTPPPILYSVRLSLHRCAVGVEVVSADLLFDGVGKDVAAGMGGDEFGQQPDR